MSRLSSRADSISDSARARQVIDGLAVVGRLNLKGPFGCVLTDSRSHNCVFHAGTSHIHHRKYHVHLLTRVGHRE